MQWHYQTRSGQRAGPVSTEAVKSLLETGALTGADSVWRVGWSQWTPIASTAEFSALAGGVSAAPPIPTASAAVAAPATAAASNPVAAAAPVANPSAPSIGYYTPRVDLPARVAANLAKHVRPTGPTDEWPLSDAHIDQFALAVRFRKHMLSSANASRLIFALCAISGVITLVAALMGRQRDMIAMIGAAGVYLLIGCLFAWFASATRRGRAWGSLVPAILATLSLVLTVAGVLLVHSANTGGPTASSAATASLVVGILSFLITLAFATAFWRGFSSTPKFLNTPVWCQEALVVAEKSK